MNSNTIILKEGLKIRLDMMTPASVISKELTVNADGLEVEAGKVTTFNIHLKEVNLTETSELEVTESGSITEEMLERNMNIAKNVISEYMFRDMPRVRSLSFLLSAVKIKTNAIGNNKNLNALFKRKNITRIERNAIHVLGTDILDTFGTPFCI